MSLIDEVVENCYTAFDTTLSTGSNTLPEIATNVLSNLGYMFNDVLNVVTENSQT